MDEDIVQKIRTRLAELPEDVQQAVTSADVGQRIQRLGTKHGLHIDQTGALSDETFMVMLGFADPAEFDDVLAQQLNIPKEKAEALAQDVSNEIFVPIRESMQEFMEERAILQAVKEERSEAPAAQKPPAPAPKPAVELHPADMMLSQTTQSVAQSTNENQKTPPASPEATKGIAKTYTNDPYREPPL